MVAEIYTNQSNKNIDDDVSMSWVLSLEKEQFCVHYYFSYLGNPRK